MLRAYTYVMPQPKCPPTRGWRKFRKLVDGRSQASVASEVGVCQQTVSAYCRRSTRPTWPRRQRIHALYGIPETDWDTANERRYAEAS